MCFSKKNIHITTCEKFISAYVGFVNTEFEAKDHLFFILNKNEKYPITGSNVIFLSGIFSYLRCMYVLCRAKKIFFHSFSGYKALLFPFILRFILKKSYWLVWGADLYAYNNKRVNLYQKIKESIRRSVFKNIGHIVSYIPGDLELATTWYQNESQRHNCIGYPSNVFHDLVLPKGNHKQITILVGNSADKTNNHSEVFDKLNSFPNIKVIVPLSYGDNTYAEKTALKGQEYFGENFVALTDFMPLKDYLYLLSTVDIAIFHHNRQQAMGNIITLLGLGKKVYVNKKSTSYSALTALNLHVFQLEKFNSDALTTADIHHNVSIIKKEFSYKRLVLQWTDIFE